ncbi:MAG: nucleotidyltransferase family protein [Treponema sp.]
MICPHFPVGIILASGMSRRMGTCKQLLQLNNKPLIQYSIETLVQAGLPYIYITVSDDIAPAMTEIIESIVAPHTLSAGTYTTAASDPAIKLVHNPHPEYGQGFSTAIATAACTTCESQRSGFLFCPADQPFLKSSSVQALCRYFVSHPDYIIAAAYNGQRGAPVIFPPAVSTELCTLCGDIGGRAVINAHTDMLRLFPLHNAEELFDIDTVEDFNYAQSISGTQQKL